MNTRLPAALLILAWAVATAPSQTTLGTTFTYQGRLESAGSPSNGVHDLRFRLYDASAGGAQVGATACFNNVTITDGLFSVPLDFGPQFAGQERFLEIDVRADTGRDCTNAAGFIVLSPRQALTAAPNALNADRLDGLDSTAFLQSIPLPLTLTGASTTHIIRAENTSTGFLPIAIFGRSSGASANGATGVRGESASNFGRGVYGEATALTGGTYGGDFRSNSTSGIGVSGSATAATGSAFGVYGESDSSAGRGVFGLATASGGDTSGVYGQSDSFFGRGVSGKTTTSSGATYGGWFESASIYGRGVLGYASAPSGATYGVWGHSNSPDGYAGFFIGGRNYFEGRVGIGTDEPERSLDVVGRVRIRQDLPAANGNSAGIDFFQQTPGEDRAFFGMRDDNQIGIYGRDGAGWSFVMDVGTGNTGVGTTTPQAKLEVNGATRTDSLEVNGGAIRVVGAGAGSNTSAFIYVVAEESNNHTIDNPLCNNRPDALLFVTDRNAYVGGGTLTSLIYLNGKWIIHTASSAPVGSKFNVLIILP